MFQDLFARLAPHISSTAYDELFEVMNLLLELSECKVKTSVVVTAIEQLSMKDPQSFGQAAKKLQETLVETCILGLDGSQSPDQITQNF